MLLSYSFLSVSLFFLIFNTNLSSVMTITCNVGHGQKGLVYTEGITWTRDCSVSDYCFQATTTDIKKVQKLIDYPWDPYYSTFYVNSCGGSLGTVQRNFHPFTKDPNRPNYDYRHGYVIVNLTYPVDVTRHGGTETFNLEYVCRKDLCSSGFRLHLAQSCGITLMMTMIITIYFYLQ